MVKELIKSSSGGIGTGGCDGDVEMSTTNKFSSILNGTISILLNIFLYILLYLLIKYFTELDWGLFGLL